MKSDASFSVILPLSRTKREYSIRRSARASRLTLKVSPAGAVEVVIPYFTSYSEAQSFVEKNSLWLERTLRKFVNRPAVPRKAEPEYYPMHFNLRFSGRDLPLFYEWKDVCWVGVRETADSLLVTGAVLNAEQVHQALRDYLLRRARELLEPLMKQTSAECGIPYGEVNFRLQQRRWGSCSGRKHISLNALLLFFPPEYVRYVMIHELCHTREMNHSANFWRLVATFCRDYKYLRSALNRESAGVIPPFLTRKN